MRIGVVLPQGWVEPLDGLEPTQAWARTAAAARTADRLGFESLWFYDHFHAWPEAGRHPTWEAFTALAVIAGVTSRARLGCLVLCAGYRNPALVAKMICTLDAASGGRVDLGIGAGWYEEEWRAFGYDFPDRRTRLGMLRDNLEVIHAMLRETPATYRGPYARVVEAVNEPKPVGDVSIMVGGNGPEVTWRLAARYADELNLDCLSPERAAGALPTIAARCEEIDRDPASLKVSVHVYCGDLGSSRQERVDTLSAFRTLGIHRLMTLPPGLTETDEVLHQLIEECREAGVSLG